MFPGAHLPVESAGHAAVSSELPSHAAQPQSMAAGVYSYQFAAPRPGMMHVDQHAMNGQQQHHHHQPAPATLQQQQQQQQWVLMPTHAAAAASMAPQHQPMSLAVASCGAMSELPGGGGGGMMMPMGGGVQYGHHQQQQQGGYMQPQSHGMMQAPPAGGQMHMGGLQQQHMQRQHHHQQQQQYGGGVLWSDVPGMRPGAGGARGPGHGMMGGPQHPLALNVAGHPSMAKASSVEELLQLLRRPPPPGVSVVEYVRDSLQYLDSRALAALLKELSKTGRRDTAFTIFNWLRDPAQSMDPAYAGLLDVFTYTTMIAQCTSRMQLDTALALMDEMRARHVPANTHTYSSLINVCVKAGNFPMALGVYNEMLAAGLQPNLVTFNTLLEVYAKQGMWREAVGVLDTLEQQRLVPEPRTFNIVMNACNAVGQFADCIKVHERMVEQNVTPTVGTYNAVLLAHCKLDQLAAAQRLFNEMRSQGCQPTHTTFIMLLQSAEVHGQAEVAVTLLEEMQAIQLCLTPQCYSAAIGACAGAGQLSTARKLLADMTASNKAGMAAPAHIIIQNQDKCCDWGGAFATYQKLIASNVRPDKQTTATAIEALWGAGHVGSCLLALKVFHASCKQGLFKADASVHPSEPIIEFVVPGSGTCMAIVGLWTLLVEMRAKALREGPGFLCRHVVLLLGDGQAQMPQLKEAMAQLCIAPGVPLQLDATSSSSSQVVLTCTSADLAGWLLAEAYTTTCPLVPGVSELEALKPSAVLAAEEAAMERVQEQYSSLTAAEARYRTPGEQVLPATYLSARPELWAQLRAACSALQPAATDLPFAAMVLLDQASAAGLVEQQQPDAAAPMLAAAVLLASEAADAGQQAAGEAASPGATATATSTSSALTEAAVASQFGVLAEQLHAAAVQLRESCAAACAAPVAVTRVVELFVQALMAGRLDYEVSAQSLVGDAVALAAKATPHPRAQELSARDLAAVLIVASRQAGGMFPAWPKCLVVLTGVLDPAAPAAAQQLLQELVPTPGAQPALGTGPQQP